MAGPGAVHDRKIVRKLHGVAADRGGLDNPGMLIALAICALALAIFMVRSWRSRRSLSRRLLTVGAIFLIGVVLAVV